MYPIIMIEPQNHLEKGHFEEQDISLMYYTHKVLNVLDFRKIDIFFIKIVFAFSEVSPLCLSSISFPFVGPCLPSHDVLTAPYICLLMKRFLQ